MNFSEWFKKLSPQIPLASAEAVLRLAEEGGTIPFIARYRKEQTGNLDEVQIELVLQQKEEWDYLIKRQSTILTEIDSQQKLTPDLKAKILNTFEKDALEDLYLPFKKKKQTKAGLAKEAGLEPLADWIWNCGHGTETPQPGQTLELWAFTFRNEEKGIKEASEAIAGAEDILTERLAEMSELRNLVRKAVFERGILESTKADGAKPNSKYEKYFNYAESISSLLKPQNAHRYSALRRGWFEKELSHRISGGKEDPHFESHAVRAFETIACTVADSPGAEILKQAARNAYKVYVFPAIEREAHHAMRDSAEAVSIHVFGDNVRTLLMAAPFGSKPVLAIDPGIRTGGKGVLIDETGKLVENTVLFIQEDAQKTSSKEWIVNSIAKLNVRAIAIGNGTGGREFELFVRAILKEASLSVPTVMVNESGASVYSASEIAREEFPEHDLTVRGAVSIGRRLQDPLAELVKIDPKSIGVGQYQHDSQSGQLKRSLARVVESCVNSVGVNLNTASYALLSYVSGIGEGLAKAIVQHRTEKGLFQSRQELLEVPRFSAKAFEQAAGFLRIPDSGHPLDNTGVHPERYPLLEAHAAALNKSISEFIGSGAALLKQGENLQQTLGQFTFDDVIKELEKPGRDPREQFIPFSYREDLQKLEDVKPGMSCPGIVTNVTNFGAFVDIGVHQDGLVHLSQLSDRFVKDPREVVKPGDRVTVRVLEVNLEKKQLAFSMKSPASERPREAPRRQAPPQRTQQTSPTNARPQGPRAPQAQVPQRAAQNNHQGLRRQEQKQRRPPKSSFRNDAFKVLAALKKG